MSLLEGVLAEGLLLAKANLCFFSSPLTMTVPGLFRGYGPTEDH